jgi:hypothetical protein
MDENIHLLYLLRLDVVLGAKSFYLGGNLSLKICGIELRYVTNSGYPFAYLPPNRVNTDTLREHEADTGNDYSLAQAVTPFVIILPPVRSDEGKNLLEDV